ncbi:MAG: YceG family protein [Lachnospiraceae bacterium]
MYQRITINKKEDYFQTMSARPTTGVYVCRLQAYDPKTEEFLQRYLREAHKCGAVIPQRLANPDEKQLSYYNEIMGSAFEQNAEFLDRAMGKWLPRLNPLQRKKVVDAMLHVLQNLQKEGKNESILKNAYMKFMCWMYYRFESVLGHLGEEQVPKVLCDGDVSSYELLMLAILSAGGCDVLIVQCDGESAYQKADPNGTLSQLLAVEGGQPFPKEVTIQSLQKKEQMRMQFAMLYQEDQVRLCATNTWLSGKTFQDSLKNVSERGTDAYIYNLFVRMTGVEEKTTYGRDLMDWKQKLQGQGRTVLVVEQLQAPTPNEIALVNQNQYQKSSQLLMDLTSKICWKKDSQLQSQARKAFLDLMEEILAQEGSNLNRAKNKGIYLVCWWERFAKQLFETPVAGTYPVFCYFGVCKTEAECLFLRFLAKLPLDVVLINPDRTKTCQLKDPVLFEQNFDGSFAMEHFPSTPQMASFGTAAYHAEQELNDLLYQDSGMYRVQQYQKSQVISLKTMYEELYQLWDQEVKYRPDFEVVDNVVRLPVMFEKINGVKDRDIFAYWRDIQKLVTADTLLVKSTAEMDRFVQIREQFPVSFLRNKRLQRSEIRKHPSYPYQIFREETQEYMLDKLQELLDSGWIKGTYERGMEYKIIACVLSLDMEVTRLIQKMDLTKKVPKLVLCCLNEQPLSVEGSILLAYLHLIGFDIAVFVPTGYQVIEQQFTQPVFLEQQIGEYIYELAAPELINRVPESQTYAKPKKEGIFSRFFHKK